MERRVQCSICSSGVELKSHQDGPELGCWEAPPLEEPQLPIQQPLVVPVWKTEVGALGLCHQGSCRTGWECLLSPVTVTSDGVAAQPHCLAAGIIQELSAHLVVLEVKSWQAPRAELCRAGTALPTQCSWSRSWQGCGHSAMAGSKANLPAACSVIGPGGVGVSL